MNVALLLDAALRAQGIPIDGVSVVDETDRQTWQIKFRPGATSQQRADGLALVASVDLAAAQAAYTVAETDATIRRTLDQDRLISAVIWVLIDQFSPPATSVKYQAVRTKVIVAYTDTPWK